MSSGLDPFARYGRLIIEDEIERIKKIAKDVPHLFRPVDGNLHPSLAKGPDKVAILGAGIAGLYTALILDSLGIRYEVLEASDRIGGRIRTHRFGDSGDYYDAGAMRYRLPKRDEDGKYLNGPFKRLADLIEYGPLNEDEDPEKHLKNQLIDYHYGVAKGSQPAFKYFNGVRRPANENDVTLSHFQAETWGIDDVYAELAPGALHEDAVQPFVKMIKRDLKKPGRKDGWTEMKKFNAFSMRGFMASGYYQPSRLLGVPLDRALPNEVIDFSNLLQGSSGGYNRALTEAVFSEIAFANTGDSAGYEWKCFKGGSETLPNAIHKYLTRDNRSHLIRTSRKVTAINEVLTYYLVPSDYRGKEIPSNATRTVLSSGKIRIDIPGHVSPYWVLERCTDVKVFIKEPNGPGTRAYRYGHVISTLPLTVLRTLDLRGAGLFSLQRNALRALDHGPSIKIAIRFKTNWWTEKLGIIGGLSSTDLPIRTIVYPSYKAGDQASKVLIASYAWTTDALRLSALASKNHEGLIELVLRNLAEAHYGWNGNNEITYPFLVEQLEGRQQPTDPLANDNNFHVMDWNNDEYAIGAFPYFSPGEFGRLYAALSFPAANGHFHFAGETVSIRHAWVVGALDSGWRAVLEYLLLTKQKEKLKEFEKVWGRNSEIEPGELAEGAEPDGGLQRELIDLNCEFD